MAFEEVKDLVTIQRPTKESGYRLNDRVWTKASNVLPWKDCVEYCNVRGARLQTLDDTVEFRHDTQGADNSNNSQHTGTLIAYVSDGKSGLRAHIYEPSEEEILQIAAKVSGVRFLDVSKDSELGKQVLQFSDGTGRTFVVPSSDISSSVQADDTGTSEYSANEDVRKLMPKNAAKNATVIQRNGYSNGCVWFYRPELAKDTMRILPVVLGGGDFDSINVVGAYYYFDGSSRARGLVHVGAQKSPQETKVKRVSRARK